MEPGNIYTDPRQGFQWYKDFDGKLYFRHSEEWRPATLTEEQILEATRSN